MVESPASTPLTKEQNFASLYGLYSKGLTYVSKHGDIKPIFKSPFFGFFLALLTSFFSYFGSKSDGITTAIKKFLQILAILFLVIAIGCFISYIFLYLKNYLPEYRNWYARLPIEAVTLLDKMQVS